MNPASEVRAGVMVAHIVTVADINGNSRRGWIVYNQSGTPLEFIEEYYNGPSEVIAKYPGLPISGPIQVTPKEWRAWKQLGAGNLAKKP